MSKHNIVLPTAPELPQMSPDGVINELDLIESNGVVIKVVKQWDSAINDSLTLYFGNAVVGRLDVNTIPFPYPWVVTVPKELVIDGNYHVFYVRTDSVGNVIASQVSTAVIDRSDTGFLPAPVFSESNNNTLTTEAIIDGFTPIHIPAYLGISDGDEVVVHFNGVNSAGEFVPSSTCVVRHEVKNTDLAEGFYVPVAASYITAIDTGGAFSWYTVDSVEGVHTKSDIAAVTIDVTQSLLPPPYFPEGNDGWIDYVEAQDGTLLMIPIYPDMSVGDVVQATWQGFVNFQPVENSKYVYTKIVNSTDLASGISVTIPPENIQPVGIGFGQGYYEVTYASTKEQGYSLEAIINVDTTHQELLPPPIFTEADSNNVIDSKDYADGTTMEISYSDMAEGDNLFIYWQGYEDGGITPVSDTDWSTQHIITQDEALSKSLVVTVPESVISPIGDGQAAGWYNINFRTGGIASSEEAMVKISSESTNTLSLNAASGAPWRDKPASIVVPLNALTIQGQPGAEIEVSLSEDAYFNDSGSPLWQGLLDINGQAILYVYRLNTPGLVNVSAYMVSNPSINASAMMTFVEYSTGKGALSGYAVSSGVAANGKTPAAVYVRTATGVGIVRIEMVSGNAVLVGHQFSSADIFISSDNTGYIDLTDTTPEIVDLSLSVPTSSGSNISTSAAFIDFP